jgi:hypothetical protein
MLEDEMETMSRELAVDREVHVRRHYSYIEKDKAEVVGEDAYVTLTMAAPVPKWG